MVYAVGGVVRDLALNRPLGDIDLTVETDPVPLAEAAANALGSTRVRRHERFSTASVEYRGTRVDIAMSRAERYATPAALPEVSPAPIAEDLQRRDFTINAIAFDLRDEVGYLDPTGGAADLELGLVRALHPASFVDDPTRLFRACRYAGRLAFEIETSTRTWMQAGLSCTGRLSAARLRNELFAILSEEAPAAAVRLARDTDVLSAALPWFAALPDARLALLDSAVGGDRVAVGLCVLAAQLNPSAIRELTACLALPRAVEAAVTALPAARLALRPFERPVSRTSELVQVCERFPLPALAAVALVSESPALRVAVESFLQDWRHFRPATPAERLMSLGYDGPLLGEVLAALRWARLDGEVDAAGELAWVEREFGSRQQADSL